MIPYGMQDITEEDIASVISVLKSSFLTQGPAVPMFEQAVASYCQAQYSLATNSATSALHLACLALDIGPGDIVWTSPVTFVASANSALYCGAKVDFVDIDPISYNISVEALENKLITAKKSGCLPKAIIAVHLSGQSCDMMAIGALANRYGVRVIEDASHAIGGRYLNEPIGRCTYSDITIFSFHPVKIITTGEGGMATTQDEKLYSRMKLLRSHGISRDDGEMEFPVDGGWYYEQQALGFNYRLTDFQAALGLSQLSRLDDYVLARHQLARRYNEALDHLPIKLPNQNEASYSSFHLYIIRLELNAINKTHKEVFEQLRAAGIGVNLHYIPIYRHPYYRQFKYEYSDFPNSESYYSEAISIPIYPMLSNDNFNKVVSALENILKK